MPAHRSSRQPPTGHHRHRGSTTGRGSHFCATNSFKPSITSSCSASSFLSLALSSSMPLSLRTSGTSMPPYLLRQRKKLCSVMLFLRQISRIESDPSASRKMRTICSYMDATLFARPNIGRARRQGCSLIFGLFLHGIRPAGHDDLRWRGPILRNEL